MLPAMGLHQRRAALTVDAPLPLDAFRVPSPAGRGAAISVQRKVLDVDAVVREKEVRLILPMLPRRRRRLVRSFVSELNPVFRQIVRDFQLLKTLDLIPAQRPQLDASDVLIESRVDMTCSQTDARQALPTTRSRHAGPIARTLVMVR